MAAGFGDRRTEKERQRKRKNNIFKKLQKCAYYDITKKSGRHSMPRPFVMTQVQHFVSQIKKRQRWEVQMMWAY